MSELNKSNLRVYQEGEGTLQETERKNSVCPFKQFKV